MKLLDVSTPGKRRKRVSERSWLWMDGSREGGFFLELIWRPAAQGSASIPMLTGKESVTT
jgi:hypothetical protein